MKKLIETRISFHLPSANDVAVHGVPGKRNFFENARNSCIFFPICYNKTAPLGQ